MAAAELTSRPGRQAPSSPRAVLLLALAMAFAFAAVALQTVRLSIGSQANGSGPRANLAEPLVRIYSRPDIVDRKGRLLATDLMVHSLFADPALVIDADEVSEQVSRILPDIDAAELRSQLTDKSRRFLWIRRGLTPAIAQRIHDLGLPGLAFRNEPRRVYPQGRMAGHVLGSVGVENRGLAGIEKHLDDVLGLESGYSPEASRPPVTLTLDLGAQHGLEEELSLALAQYGATGAAGVIIDAGTGAIRAAASLPDADPARPGESLLPDRIDRLNTATYELGSILKVFTVAMALEHKLATPSTVIDVRVPLQTGRWTIRDTYPSGRPLTVREILVQSSNVGVARLALAAGADRQRRFLQRVGLVDPIRIETGPLGPPRLPEHWREVETATIAYGYGLALAPMQVAAATASLLNGGLYVTPHLVELIPGIARKEEAPRRIVSEATSDAMREMMRRVVTQSGGTGHRADVPGFDVGGKTGTAELSARGGYRARSVVASFLAAFPMSAPRYVVLITLIEPKPVAGDAQQKITAGLNAAPIAARVIRRTAAALDVVPQ